MKIKGLVLLVMGLLVMNVMVAAAQPAHACGTIFSLSVTYDRDAAGYYPKMAAGDQNQFNCVADRDQSFSSQRFDAGYKAANYFLGLLGQELGVNMLMLPAPSSP